MVQERIEGGAPGFYSWTSIEQMHVTLYFLGEMEAEPLEEVCTHCRSLPWENFSVGLSKLVLFPNQFTPRILAVGTSEGAEPLISLQRRIADRVLSLAQFKEERAYFPHVTLGRLKRGMPGNAKAVKGTLSRLDVPDYAPFEVSEFVLMRSTLTSQGPVYETVEKFSSR